VEVVPAGFTVKVRPFTLVPPPPEFGLWTPPLPAGVPAAGGLYTVTMPVTGAAVVLTSRLEAKVAVIWVEVTLRIGSVDCVGPRLKRTCEPPEGSEVGIKFVPVTVIVKEAAPAVAEVGEMAEIVGSGLAAGLMRKVSVLERPLLPAPEKGLRVLTKAVPALAISAALTVAVTLLALT